QLSYLGSMLRREPTEEEAEMQRILDARADAKAKGSVRRKRISRKKRASNLVPWPPISPRVVPDLGVRSFLCTFVADTKRHPNPSPPRPLCDDSFGFRVLLRPKHSRWLYISSMM